MDSLAGKWVRLAAASRCGERYPDAIEFKAGGRYTAKNTGPYVTWDLGSWEMLGPREVRISLANDSKVAYGFQVSGDRVEFTDPEGCRFSYVRGG